MTLLRLFRGLAVVSVVGAAAACGEAVTASPTLTGAGLTESSSSGGAASAAAEASGAQSIATDAISCVLRASSVSAERCREVATMAGTTLEGLQRADHSVVDQLGEVVVRRARSERMPAQQRAGLARWFDLGIAAAREAAVANVAARSASLQRARANEMTAGDLDAIEAAAQRDASEVRSRAHLDSLMAFAREGLDGASDAEAVAVVVALARVDGARGAHEMTRSDTVQSSVDIAVDIAGASTVRALSDRANSGERAALRAGSEAPSLDDARARLRLRATEVCARASGAVRAWCDGAAQR